MGLFKYIKYQKLLHKAERAGRGIIDIDLIKIPEGFEKAPPRKGKMISKRRYFEQNNWFASPVVLNKNFKLVDGYTSYLIAKENGFRLVPVKFE